MNLRGGAKVGSQLTGGYPGNLARKSRRFLVVRPSLGVKIEVGTWFFNEGEVLDGTLITHPVNAARKIIIRTNQGTFSVNEEDVTKL